MKKSAFVLALAATTLYVTTTHAAAEGWYLGLGVGQSKARDIEDNLDPFLKALEPLPTSLEPVLAYDDEATAWRVFAGYRLNKHVAVETGYTGFGKFSYSGNYSYDNPGTLPDFSGSFAGKAEPKIWTLGALAILPLGSQFELFGKLGAAFWEMETTETMATTVGSESQRSSRSASKTGSSLNVGLGLQYSLSNSLALRLEWERFDDVGEKTLTGETDIDLLTLGVAYRF